MSRFLRSRPTRSTPKSRLRSLASCAASPSPRMRPWPSGPNSPSLTRTARPASRPHPLQRRLRRLPQSRPNRCSQERHRQPRHRKHSLPPPLMPSLPRKPSRRRLLSNLSTLRRRISSLRPVIRPPRQRPPRPRLSRHRRPRSRRRPPSLLRPTSRPRRTRLLAMTSAATGRLPRRRNSPRTSRMARMSLRWSAS